MDHERTFVIHWSDGEAPASPDPIFQTLSKIVRPRAISIDSFRSRDEIDHWPGSISSSTASFDYPTGVMSPAMLEGEIAKDQLGLTRIHRRYDDQWSRWLEHRILQARISDELVERDDSIDVLVWGETKLGVLPLMTPGEEWFLRQKLSDDYAPILDVIVSLAGPEARLTDLLITIYSPVYSTEDQFIRMVSEDCQHSWLPRFLSESMDCFREWFEKLIKRYPDDTIRWHDDGCPILGTRLDTIFTDLLGPGEERWAADVG